MVRVLVVCVLAVRLVALRMLGVMLMCPVIHMLNPCKSCDAFLKAAASSTLPRREGQATVNGASRTVGARRPMHTP